MITAFRAHGSVLDDPDILIANRDRWPSRKSCRARAGTSQGRQPAADRGPMTSRGASSLARSWANKRLGRGTRSRAVAGSGARLSANRRKRSARGHRHPGPAARSSTDGAKDGPPKLEKKNQRRLSKARLEPQRVVHRQVTRRTIIDGDGTTGDQDQARIKQIQGRGSRRADSGLRSRRSSRGGASRRLSGWCRPSSRAGRGHEGPETEGEKKPSPSRTRCRRPRGP